MIYFEVLLKQEGIIFEAKDLEEFKQKLAKVNVFDVCYEPQKMTQAQFEAELKKRLVYLKKP